VDSLLADCVARPAKLQICDAMIVHRKNVAAIEGPEVAR
jgi:hypothetical protein